MGNNEAFAIMEAQIIGAYDLGVLDKKLCKVLLKPFAETDMDEGGKADLVTKVGELGVEEVVALVMNGKVPKRPAGPQADWTDDDWDAWNDARYAAFDRALRVAWGRR